MSTGSSTTSPCASPAATHRRRPPADPLLPQRSTPRPPHLRHTTLRTCFPFAGPTDGGDEPRRSQREPGRRKTGPFHCSSTSASSAQGAAIIMPLNVRMPPASGKRVNEDVDGDQLLPEDLISTGGSKTDSVVWICVSVGCPDLRELSLK
ncbi:unnamed protein product [Urochloa humidicola]